MKLLEPLGLVMQRFLAFSLDMGGACLCGLLLFVVWGGSWGDWWESGILLVALLYFACFERFTGGRTPGKVLLGLRVLGATGAAADGFSLTLRAAVVLFAAPFSGLVRDVASLVAPDIVPSSLAARFFGLALTPASIVVGAGYAGLHDLAAGTQVLPAWRPSVARDGRKGLEVRVALTLLLAAGGAWLPCRWLDALTTKIQTNLQVQSVTREGLRALSDLVPTAAEIAEHVDNSGLYLSGGFHAVEVPWSDGLQRTFRKSVHASKLSPRLRDGTLALSRYRRFEIGTTYDGFLSGDFQAELAMWLASRTPLPGDTMMECAFVFDDRFPFIGIRAERRLIGLWASAKSGEPTFLLLEPDGSVFIGARLSLLEVR